MRLFECLLVLVAACSLPVMSIAAAEEPAAADGMPTPEGNFTSATQFLLRASIGGLEKEFNLTRLFSIANSFVDGLEQATMQLNRMGIPPTQEG